MKKTIDPQDLVPVTLVTVADDEFDSVKFLTGDNRVLTISISSTPGGGQTIKFEIDQSH